MLSPAFMTPTSRRLLSQRCAFMIGLILSLFFVFAQPPICVESERVQRIIRGSVPMRGPEDAINHQYTEQRASSCSFLQVKDATEWICIECKRAFTTQNCLRCCDDHNGVSATPTTVAGFFIEQNSISEPDELQVVDALDHRYSWKDSQSGRRKQEYGPKKNFKKKKLKLPETRGVPLALKSLIDKAAKFARDCTGEEFRLAEASALEYTEARSSGFDPHIDDTWLWGKRILGANLLADCPFTFVGPSGFSVNVLLPRGALFLMSGASRFEWMHGVHPDCISGRRISITMRELSDEILSELLDALPTQMEVSQAHGSLLEQSKIKHQKLNIEIRNRWLEYRIERGNSNINCLYYLHSDPLPSFPLLPSECESGSLTMSARQMTNASFQPLWTELPREQLTDSCGSVKVESLLLHLLRGGKLCPADALQIAELAAAKLRSEQNVLRVQGTVTVVGDLHGQFYDLAKIVKLNGMPPGITYLFLGNYIGGGGFNCETLLLLLAAKIRSAFDFELECNLKYTKQLCLVFLKVFESLPLAAVLNQTYFCVHGGLSPDIEYIESIGSFPRFREVPSQGPMCDLLWADPHWDADNPASVERSPSDEYYTPGTHYHDMNPDFSPNKKRGRSYVFNFASIKYFMAKNKILCIIRSHEVEDSGYKLYRVLPSTNYPCMISVFSAPNYCGSFENMGAVVTIGQEITIKKFYRSPCPYVLPKGNTFLWSAPFVVTNVVDFFEELLGPS
eukprot:gene5124-3678_t